MKKIYIVVLVAMVVGLGSCKKSVLDCTYVIKPLVQLTSTSTDVIAEGAFAYTFFADTTMWWPTTWADAEKGLIGSRSNPTETKSYDLVTQQNAEGMIEIGSLKTITAIVMVCDPVNKIFAWRQIELAENLSYLFVKVRFRPWKPSKEYFEARWTVVNEFAPEPEPEPDPDPKPDPDPDPDPDPKPEPTVG